MCETDKDKVAILITEETTPLLDRNRQLVAKRRKVDCYLVVPMCMAMFAVLIIVPLFIILPMYSDGEIS